MIVNLKVSLAPYNISLLSFLFFFFFLFVFISIFFVRGFVKGYPQVLVTLICWFLFKGRALKHQSLTLWAWVSLSLLNFCLWQ